MIPNPDILETIRIQQVSLPHDLVVIEKQVNRLLWRVYKSHGILAVQAMLCAEITAFCDYHAETVEHQSKGKLT